MVGILANDSSNLHPLFLKSMGGEETLQVARMQAGGAQIWRQQEADGKRSAIAERRKEMVEAMARRPRWRSDPASNSTGLTIAEAAAADKHQREILRQGGSLVSSSPADMGRLQNAFAFDDLKKHASTGELAQKMAAANMAVYDQLVADQFVEEQLVTELYYQRAQRRTEEQKQHHREVCLRSQLWCAAIDSPYTLKKRREARERERDRLTALELKPRFRDIEEEIEPLLRFQAAVARFGPDLVPPGPASPSVLLEKARRKLPGLKRDALLNPPFVPLVPTAVAHDLHRKQILAESGFRIGKTRSTSPNASPQSSPPKSAPFSTVQQQPPSALTTHSSRLPSLDAPDPVGGRANHLCLSATPPILLETLTLPLASSPLSSPLSRQPLPPSPRQPPPTARQSREPREPLSPRQPATARASTSAFSRRGQYSEAAPQGSVEGHQPPPATAVSRRNLSFNLSSETDEGSSLAMPAVS